MELTEEEKQSVLLMREAKIREENDKKLTLEILRMAYEFEKHNQENQQGMSFSEFTNVFDYENIHHADTSIYKLVQNIINEARMR